MENFGSNANKTKTLTLGFEGLTLPPSNGSMSPCSGRGPPRIATDGRLSSVLAAVVHHCLRAGRSSSHRIGSRHARPFAGRGRSRAAVVVLGPLWSPLLKGVALW
jgi:hypothetical protein